MNKYTNGIIFNGEIHDVIPPSPSKELRGGIKAQPKSTTDTVEIKVGEDDKLYAPSYPTSLPASDVPSWAKQTSKPTYTAAEVGADAKGSSANALAEAKSYTDTKTSGLVSTTVVDNKITAHNTASDAHSDIRTLITELTTIINTILNSKDVDLDQLAELVAYIKANRSLIEQITTNKINVSDIIDNLTTNVANKPLSAKQGVALKALIDAIKVPTALSELSADATHRLVTDTEKAAWNAKSDFSGSYNDLTNKPTIPSKTSQLTNDSGYITKAPVEVAVQDGTPSEGSIWIDTDASEEILIAEIDDDAISEEKTWSSNKINNEVDELNEKLVQQKAYATPQMYEGTDAEKIQQAIDKNGFVIIPSGDYTIDSTITIPSSRKIQIEGKIWVNCEVGFMIQGNDIEFCGHGVVNIQSSLTNCSAFRFLLNQDLRFITLKDLTIWGAWNHNNDKNHIGIEFVGDSTVGTCCYVNINCNINCTTKGIWSHEATGQNADSWLTQVDVNSTFQNCLQAIAYEWGGGASRIRGVIQPKCTSAVTPNSVDLPLCILPEQTYMDAMVWDMHAAMNKYAIKVTGQNVTIFTALSKSYMDIASVVKPSLTLRIPTENILTKDDIDTSDPTLDIEFRIDNDGNLIMEKEAPYKNLFSGVSYQNGYRINSSGDLVAQSGAVTTDFIPYSDVSDSDLLMVKGASFGTAFGCLVVFYDENHTLLQGVRIMPDHFVSAYIIGSATVAFTGDSTKHPTIDENGITTIKINYDESQVVKTPIAYIRLVLEGTGSDLIVTRNEEIVDYDAEGKNIGKVKPKYGVDYFTTDEQEEFANAIIAKQKTETWTFTLADGSTVTKKVVLA